jgi:hypothetical protein
MLLHFAKDERAYIASERFFLPERDCLSFCGGNDLPWSISSRGAALSCSSQPPTAVTAPTRMWGRMRDREGLLWIRSIAVAAFCKVQALPE